MPDRDLIERHVDRIVVKPKGIEVWLKAEDGDGRNNLGAPDLLAPWSAPVFAATKGIVHTPSTIVLKAETRDAVLTAIAKARAWIDDLAENRTKSFAEIATREGKVERHIRLLAPLAFVSPKIIAAIVEGTAPADLTVTGLAKALPFSWVDQERKLGLPAI
jgi:site-specific DNA recombinase